MTTPTQPSKREAALTVMRDAMMRSAAGRGVRLAPPLASELAAAAFDASQPLPLPGVAGPLTRRQTQLLGMVSCGRTYGQIAAELHITEHTVKTTLKRAYGRLGAESGAHAVGIAYRQGLLTVPNERMGAAS